MIYILEKRNFQKARRKQREIQQSQAENYRNKEKGDMFALIYMYINNENCIMIVCRTFQNEHRSLPTVFLHLFLDPNET